jgi:hypothetical protein
MADEQQLPENATPNNQNQFQLPVVDEPQNAESANVDFEKYKIKIGILKWLIGTIGLTLITYAINWGFKDRESGMLEISQYDKYATELIVLSSNPVKRRMLAQFFANVTPSEKLKNGWKGYYKDINPEYLKFITSDSLDRIRFAKLNKDTTLLTSAEKTERENIEIKIKQNDEIVNGPLITPDNINVSASAVYIEAVSISKDKAEEVRTLLNKNGFNALGIEYMNKDKYKLNNNELRYYFDADKKIGEQLQLLLKNMAVETELKFFPSLNSNVKQGTIELWLK